MNPFLILSIWYMTGGAILPVAVHKNKLYFLMGRENKLEKSAKGWADFGGGSKSNETPYDTAVREGSEELCGFLGGEDIMHERLKETYSFHYKTYHVFICRLPYDPNLPTYYNLQHEFLWNKLDQKMLTKSCCFEKDNIRWFSEKDLKTHIHVFRPFYQEVVHEMVTHHMKELYQFMGIKN
jgi:8-oxo-dGTP pyrophosphatase MutT (NUDIX family)